MLQTIIAMAGIKHIILVLLIAGGGVTASASNYTEANYTTEVETQTITMSVKGSDVRIGNAAGLVLEVYNITGLKVGCYKIDSADKTISLSHLSKSCYILKVGQTVRKISIL